MSTLRQQNQVWDRRQNWAALPKAPKFYQNWYVCKFIPWSIDSPWEPITSTKTMPMWTWMSIWKEITRVNIRWQTMLEKEKTTGVQPWSKTSLVPGCRHAIHLKDVLIELVLVNLAFVSHNCLPMGISKLEDWENFLNMIPERAKWTPVLRPQTH